MRLKVRIVALIVLFLFGALVAFGLLTSIQVTKFQKDGTSMGCFFTSSKGSSFPRTLVEWDVLSGDTVEVSMMIKLGESPLPPNMSTSFGIFVKNAYPYPSAELPEDDLRLFGTVRSAQWIARVAILGTDGTETFENDTSPAPLDPQHWYELRIVIEGFHHSFYVNGSQIASITLPDSLHPSHYGRRTAFGVTMGPLSHGCFGDYHVRSRGPLVQLVLGRWDYGFPLAIPIGRECSS